MPNSDDLNQLEGSKTLIALLSSRARHQPDDIAFIFLRDGDTDEVSLTYQSLHKTACAIAGYLQAVMQPGERALLIYPSGLEFICAFFGCLYAGILAIPVQAPRANRGFSSLKAIIDNAKPTLVLTERGLSDLVKSNLLTLPVIVTDNIDISCPDNWIIPSVDEKSLAFLQYTSGSTGAPKGVMVSHGNLLHNQSIIKRAFSHDSRSIIVAWLPFYHDMGLIGNMLQPIYLGRPCIFMQPMAFLQNPFLWLQAISRYRGTTSGGPSFAYELCLRKIAPQQRETLDLACWTTAFNGAEPVRADVLTRFASYFEPCHFKKSAFLPCYGMAEATLFITGGGQSRRPLIRQVEQKSLENNQVMIDSSEKEANIALVGCGESSPDQHVCIVSPKTFELCRGTEVGEIWVSGLSVATGYWNNLSATNETFRAQIKNTDSVIASPVPNIPSLQCTKQSSEQCSEPWIASGARKDEIGDLMTKVKNTDSHYYLRTGDLGFIFEGELFIVGRLKDLIIIRGRNYYPQDIEQQVEKSHLSLKANCGAAFSIEVMGEERLVIVQEVERSHIRSLDVKTVMTEIRKSIANYFDLTVHAILLLKTGQVLKTSSGKIKRAMCKQYFLNHTFQVIASNIEEDGVDKCNDVAERPDTAEKMQLFFVDFIAKNLKISTSEVDVGQSLSSLGIDSLIAVDLKNHLQLNTGIDWPAVRFLQDETIQQLSSSAIAQFDITAIDSHNNQQYLNSMESPLSSSQQAIYFLHKLAPESAVYNVSFAFTIKQHLNKEGWNFVWQQLIERHPSLRTTYHVVDGQTVQRVHDKIETPMHWDDRRFIDQETLEQIINVEACRPFILDKEPALRLRLYSKSQDETVFLFVAHHIICDLYSIITLMKECGHLYQQFMQNITLSLPDIKMSYTDYVYRQMNLCVTDKALQHANYWKEKLSGDLPTLNLITDSRRQSVQTFNGSCIPFTFNKEIYSKLISLSKSTSTTLYMVLVAVFQVLLHRYTHQDDLLIGSPVAGRTDADTQTIVGCFINTIVLRAIFSPELSFIDFLSQVRRTVLEAFEHQNYPFHKIVEHVQLQRDIRDIPVLQAMLILQNAKTLEDAAPFLLNEKNALLNLSGIDVESFPLMKQTALYDITLLLVETKEGLSGSFEYNSDLFDVETIQGMSQHFIEILDEILQNPNQKIEQLLVAKPALEKNPSSEPQEANDLVTPSVIKSPVSNTPSLRGTKQSMEQCSELWIASQARKDEIGDLMTEALVKDNISFLHYFEACAIKKPHAIAVQFDSLQMTYQALNERSNQLANYLQHEGVQTETLVGVFLERSIDMLVALLAILKAGGAYLPLDPSYPRERLEYMVMDSKLALLITQQNMVNKINTSHLKRINLDVDLALIEKQGINTPQRDWLISNLAYVLYTSGSTGRPKGVLIQHDSLNNFLQAMLMSIELQENDILLAVTTISFDIAALELFLPLMVGARVVLADSKSTYNVDSLVYALNYFNVSVMQATPATWQLLLASGWSCKKGFKALVGGEVLPPIVAEKLHQGGCLTWNLYGPTENTVWTTLYAVKDIKKDKFGHLKSIPIGKPLCNVQTYILDNKLQLTPAGISGELYLGGSGLARGYLNQTELTQTKFIQHPYSKNSTDRLYATGDLARFLPDGNIEFLGRKDSQVKLRGYRIEIGEIENTLLKHEAIVECTVILHPESLEKDSFLAAYIVSKTSIKRVDLQQFLMNFLPAYMVPSTFQFLPSLPRTQNNKIDRLAIAKLDLSLIKNEDSYTPPETATEILLATIWCDVLKIKKISIHDNFFHLGGHSLLALMVSNQLIENHSIHIPLHLIFERQTIAKLAIDIDKHMADSLHRNMNVRSILDQVKNLSPDEVKRLLQEKRIKPVNV